MATSTIPTIKAALLSGLSALPALAGVSVVYGPDDREVARESIYLGGTDEWEQDWHAIGGLTRDESYVLRLVVWVHTPGLTQQLATERAFTLLGAVEDYLRTNNDLGQAAVRINRTELLRGDLVEFPHDEGRAAAIVSGVRVRTRI